MLCDTAVGTAFCVTLQRARRVVSLTATIYFVDSLEPWQRLTRVIYLTYAPRSRDPFVLLVAVTQAVFLSQVYRGYPFPTPASVLASARHCRGKLKTRNVADNTLKDNTRHICDTPHDSCLRCSHLCFRFVIFTSASSALARVQTLPATGRMSKYNYYF